MRRLLVVVSIVAGLGAAEADPASVIPPQTGSQPMAAADAGGFAALLARSPGIAAARDRLRGARRAAGAAGVLPDPMAGGDWGRERMRDGMRTTMYGAMIEQPLPRWGERDAARQRAQARIRAAEAALADTVGEHAAGWAMAAAEASAARAAIVELDRTREALASLRTVLSARIASGGGLVAEALAIDTRLQETAVNRAAAERRIADADAEVRARLGISAADPLPPDPPAGPALVAPEGIPSALRASAMLGEARAMEVEAAARRWPETAVGLAWTREAAGTDAQSDQVALTLRVSLPVWQGAYADGLAGARAEARAAEHERHAEERMAAAAVSRAQRARDQADAAAALAVAAEQRLRTELDAVHRQVASGTASLAMALELQERIAGARRMAVDAEREARLAQAGLWRLAPPTLPEEGRP